MFQTRGTTCEVRLFSSSPPFAPVATHPLAPSPGNEGVFEATIPGVGPGALYKFVIDGTELPDPYARALPHGVHGPAEVTSSSYAWRHGEGVARPAHEQVIYELHVGTFTPEGTYAAAARKLHALVDLGVTVVELMPLSSFAGTRGWGYDGVAHFAPYAPYGTPDQLRAFIDEAHALGLSVFLDVVYNHFGPAGNYLGAYSDGYFMKDKSSAWGDGLDFAHAPMRRYVLDNARYWLTEFRFDGLRLDATSAIHDASLPHLLHQLVEDTAGLSPRKTLIAEDERNEPTLVTDVGLDGIWADDFHHQVRVSLTGEKDGYYGGYEPGLEGIARAIERGWLYEGQKTPAGEPRGKPAIDMPPQAFVYAISNHDQVGNRALGERLSADVSLDAYRAVSALLLFLPATPLLFMGQEWAASTPFLFFTDHDAELGAKIVEGRRGEFKHFEAFSNPEMRERIPNPQDTRTFERSRLDWHERERAPHAAVLGFYRELLRLRRQDPVLRAPASKRPRVRVHAAPGEAPTEGVLEVVRAHGENARVLLVNLGKKPRALPPREGAGFVRGRAILASRDELSTAPLNTLPKECAIVFEATLSPQ